MTNDIIDRQREFFLTGKTLDVSFRKSMLEKLYEGIRKHECEIADALYRDLGKSRPEGYMCETGLSLSEIRFTIRHIRKWSRTRKVPTPLAQFPASSRIIPEPYGNVLVMSPWNYPFLLCISPLVSAIAAGNTVIIKPSAYSPATSSVIRKLIEETFPPELVTVMEGGREVNSSLLENKFDYIFFTGSKEVGKIVMKKAAEHLTPVTLELGGKSPSIVCRDASLKIAARRLVFGKFLNCGQTCVAPDYLMVHKDVADEFIGFCRQEAVSMFGIAPLSNRNYGKIVNEKHFERLTSLIEDSCGTGKVELGGHSDKETGQIEPTIIRIGHLDSGNGKKWTNLDKLPLMQDEIFGPILPVITYDDETDVMDYINAHPKPLATYVFSENRKLVRKILAGIRFGGGCVNDTIIHLATDDMPFGGVGESGMGNYHGKFGFDTFSHMKSIVDKPVWLDLPMRYQPYTKFKEKVIRFFLR